MKKTNPQDREARRTQRQRRDSRDEPEYNESGVRRVPRPVMPAAPAAEEPRQAPPYPVEDPVFTPPDPQTVERYHRQREVRRDSFITDPTEDELREIVSAPADRSRFTDPYDVKGMREARRLEREQWAREAREREHREAQGQHEPAQAAPQTDNPTVKDVQTEADQTPVEPFDSRSFTDVEEPARGESDRGAEAAQKAEDALHRRQLEAQERLRQPEPDFGQTIGLSRRGHSPGLDNIDSFRDAKPASKQANSQQVKRPAAQQTPLPAQQQAPGWTQAKRTAPGSAQPVANEANPDGRYRVLTTDEADNAPADQRSRKARRSSKGNIRSVHITPQPHFSHPAQPIESGQEQQPDDADEPRTSSGRRRLITKDLVHLNIPESEQSRLKKKRSSVFDNELYQLEDPGIPDFLREGDLSSSARRSQAMREEQEQNETDLKARISRSADKAESLEAPAAAAQSDEPEPAPQLPAGEQPAAGEAAARKSSPPVNYKVTAPKKVNPLDQPEIKGLEAREAVDWPQAQEEDPADPVVGPIEFESLFAQLDAENRAKEEREAGRREAAERQRLERLERELQAEAERRELMRREAALKEAESRERRARELSEKKQSEESLAEEARRRANEAELARIQAEAQVRAQQGVVDQAEIDLDRTTLDMASLASSAAQPIELTEDEQARVDAAVDAAEEDDAEPEIIEPRRIDEVEAAIDEVEAATEEDAAVEEPVIEEPAIEEPAIEEPAVEEPAVEEPAVEELVIEEPVVEEPPVEEEPAAPETEAAEPEEEALDWNRIDNKTSGIDLFQPTDQSEEDEEDEDISLFSRIRRRFGRQRDSSDS